MLFIMVFIPSIESKLRYTASILTSSLSPTSHLFIFTTVTLIVMGIRDKYIFCHKSVGTIIFKFSIVADISVADIINLNNRVKLAALKHCHSMSAAS